jgi:hypothetical protein
VKYPLTNISLKNLIVEEIYRFLKEEEPIDTPKEVGEYEDLLKKADPKSGSQRTALFKRFANYTKQNYNQELGSLNTIFPPGAQIKDWKSLSEQYARENEIEYKNVGERVEGALAQYAKDNGADAKVIDGRGEDVEVDGKILEVKSSSTDKIQANLQTTAFKNDKNKFYAFVTDTGSDTITVNIVSSHLLYKLSLGKEYTDELEKGASEKLKVAIKKGVNEIDIENLIYNTLATGREDSAVKSFKIGKGLRVRFKIEFKYEPSAESPDKSKVGES